MWHRLELGESDWPRRLIWCLPMRVLVQQTQEVAKRLVQQWAEMAGRSSDDVAVERLMGGVDVGDWHLHPERPAILIGTQDMLLSRALNRGYASGRARWPIDFGLLNHDCLWVMDEIQLMDVGLATSVQLQAFREQAAAKSLRPCRTWWMSATLQEDWLETVDFHDSLSTLRQHVLQVPPPERTGVVWEIRKPVRVETIPSKPKDDFAAWAELILAEHRAAEPDQTGRVTLVIVNRVERAGDVYKAVTKALAKDNAAPQVELIHSRFRGVEREEWSKEFLSKAHCLNKSTNLILIATQVVEAGVDISATALVTELAPWPSLVQRFGRAARYGGTARMVVVDRQVDEKSALPYELPDLTASREAIARLSDVGVAGLQEFEDRLRSDETEFLKRLYRYEYLHLLTRRECDELFDTSPDLTGADLDISRFIREGEERDVQVCWLNTKEMFNPNAEGVGEESADARSDELGNAHADGVEVKRGGPPSDWQPLRGGLCPVPVHRALKWFFDGNKLQKELSGRVWVWDYLADEWRPPTPDRCFAGQVFFVDIECGGYDPKLGFTGEKLGKNETAISDEGCVDRGQTKHTDRADLGQSREDRSLSDWKTIATHGREVAKTAREILRTLGTDDELIEIVELAGLWHDWGKAHPAFQFNIKTSNGHPGCDDLAKAPPAAWVRFNAKAYAWPERNRSPMRGFGKRSGFRHELAGVLAIFEVLSQHNQLHAALLGPHRELIDCGVLSVTTSNEPPADNPLAARLSRLTAEQFDLLVYLIGTHHGKVRGAIQGTPQDQDFDVTDVMLRGTGQPLRGVRDGDDVPETRLFMSLSDSAPSPIPPVTLHLDLAAIGLSNRYGASWSERVQSLLQRFGPFTLAWLEAVFRAADAVASQSKEPDPLL